MNTYKNRRAPGGWIGGIDWRDIRACCGKAAWYVFVVAMLAVALRGAA